MAKILVIDDEESIRYTFENFLKEEGHEVSTVSDYAGAMASVFENDFDLIFSDIILGGKTGIDFLREFGKKNLTCPVIMITGYPTVETASDAVRLGAFDFIQKPVELETLVHATNLALRYKAVADEKEQYKNNLDAIFRSVEDGIITVDEELVVIEINEAVKNICGISRDAIGKNFSSLVLTCNCMGILLKALEETNATKNPVRLDRVECRHMEDVPRILSLTISPLIRKRGTFSGAVVVVRDETREVLLEQELGERRRFHSIIGKSEPMQKIYSLITTLADVETSVLVTGETGTGKELIAEAIHYGGSRSHMPLVKVNCSVLSENLLESELFGHVKGAFTGAVRDRVGRFHMANGGTIFLDEIGDISPKVQASLLRVLQDKEFERVGDSNPIKVDVRVIAATNKDLVNKVKCGVFREDLLFRLKVIEVHIPPLRERREDIPYLVDHFIAKFNNKLNKKVVAVSMDVEKVFKDYHWPGNVRELEHSLEHAFIFCQQETITIDQLPSQLRDPAQKQAPPIEWKGSADVREIVAALEKTGWNKAKAARLLGIDRKTLYRYIEKFNIYEDD